MTSPLESNELTDRQSIRALIDAYAHHADRRETQRQADLFTEDAKIEVYPGEPGQHEPITTIQGHQALLAGFADLKTYDVTQHVNGQHTVVLEGDRATGEVYCLAHHIWIEHGQRMFMVMGIRYYDTYVRTAGRWLFAERKLIIDWTDKRPSNP
ncbi:nuclear transport factor 2 family protein [Spirosoma sp. HMF4905]|uniref:Nuclear transport factor 2 family protein n=1 Tax=Spirosoma arboris TaxID=2682092 RepID=A0A7K1SJ70_9BACT|nr:nuclear transport factor 2 family protein [Spirosoma arboris]MVM33815.1 nuclear transport factor 2 family protein [Spirosoma arboris]